MEAPGGFDSRRDSDAIQLGIYAEESRMAMAG
jgi:hypothetical protein